MTISAKTWARIGAIAFVAFAILVSALSLRHGRSGSVAPSITVARESGAVTDPLVGELFRCQALGQGAESDAGCLRAWAENRRRFLAPGARPEARLPATSMFPDAQGVPDPAAAPPVGGRP